MTLSASHEGLDLSTLGDEVRSVDVFFGSARVWSVDTREFSKVGLRTVSWPQALRPHLIGATEVELRRSDSGEVLAQAHVRFTRDEVTTQVVDKSGAPLVVNKWGRLGKTLGAGDADLQMRVLERAQVLVSQLQELDFRPFVVGGTLLGGVREGRLLPHDDDADIAYLSEFSTPVDVAREGFELGHRLEELGYELVRRSATHMQIYFRDARGDIDFYLDVFAAFFTDDGHINQPFHVRGRFLEDQMLPFGEVEISGISFPAPADPEAWLVVNYDEDWRTPIPGYELNTDPLTARRFDSWFGLFNFRREFWDDTFREASASTTSRWRSGADWIFHQSKDLVAPSLIDLGAGAGELALRLANDRIDRRVIAADYSREALAMVQGRAHEAGVELARLNLYRINSVGIFASMRIRGPVDVVANHLLEQVGHFARENALRIGRMALRTGGSFIGTVYRKPALDVNYEDPSTWHLTALTLKKEAIRLGMVVEFYPIEASDRETHREPVGIRFRLARDAQETEKESTLNAFRKLGERVKSALASRDALRELRAEVHRLESELDDLRRDHLRVAELIDLVEHLLGPADARRKP